MSTSWEAFERAGWDARVDPYHRFFAPICRAMAPRLLELARVRAGADVLDLCCGPGYAAENAIALAARPCGLHISAGMVALARRMVPSADFVVGDAERLPFATQSLDAIVCSFGLDHLPHPERTAVECGRALRPGGRFVSSV